MAAGFRPIVIEKEKRQEYLKTLETYSKNQNMQPFTEMVFELEGQQLDEYLAIGCEHDFGDTEVERDKDFVTKGFESRYPISKKTWHLLSQSLNDGFSKSREAA